MAVYVSFGVESETEEGIAEAATRFEAFTIMVAGLEVKMASAGIFPANGCWYYHADPAGVMHNGGKYVPALNTEEARAVMREAFYDRLRGLGSFRRALFRTEALDCLAYDPTEFFRVDIPDLIVREELIKDACLRSTCEVFSPGYVRIASAQPWDTDSMRAWSQ